MSESYDSVTTDLRPSAFDELREQNTTLATENERLRTALAVTEAALADASEESRLVRVGREADADAFLKRINRLRRAVVGLRRDREILATHVAQHHDDIDHAIVRLREHGCAVKELTRQRTELTEALSQMNDVALTAVAERDEARRALATVVGRECICPEGRRRSDCVQHGWYTVQEIPSGE